MYILDHPENVTCTMFGRMKQKNGWSRRKPRTNEDNLFVFVTDGEAEFTMGDAHYRVRGGDVLILPANHTYSANTKSTCEYYFFHFTGALSSGQTVDPDDLPPGDFSFYLSAPAHRRIVVPALCASGEDYSLLHRSILFCGDCAIRRTHEARLLLDTEFCKILLLLSEISRVHRQEAVYPPALRKMLSYIQENLTAPLTLAQLSRQCQVSPSYAGRLFQKHFRTTATQYIHDVKLDYARELLRDTRLKVSEIADYLGYSDVFYFSRRFKRRFGIPPTKLD